MRITRPIGAVLAVALGLGPATAAGRATHAPAIGPPQTEPSCTNLAATHASAVYRQGGVVVYRAAEPGDGGPQDWACAGGATGIASAAPLGTASGGGFVPGAVVDHFVSQGPWLVDLVSSKRGWSCPLAVKGQPCPREHHEIELTDTADAGQTSSASGADVDIHLSVAPVHDERRSAAVAWTQPAPGSLTTLKFLVASDSTTRQGSGGFGLTPVVTGKIVPGSVQMHGLTVTFTEGGRHRTVKLGA